MPRQQNAGETSPESIRNCPEIIRVDCGADSVRCDGGNPETGHPAVFYSFNGQNSVRCGYCDRVFVRDSTNGAPR